MKLSNRRAVRFGIALVGLAAVAMVLQGQAPNSPGPFRHRIPLPQDWSHRHLIYSSSGTLGQALQNQQRHRFWHQWFRRNVRAEIPDKEGAFSSEFGHRHHVNDAGDGLQRDWGISLGPGATVGEGMSPAKFTFDINATASCANDFVVFNTSLTGNTSLNIVGFNNLYAGGICSTGPSVLFAYRTQTNTGISGTLTSPTLSFDGAQVAYMEGGGGGTGVLHILRWEPGDGGTVGAPVLVTTSVTTGANYVTCKATATSCLLSLVFGNASGSTSSEPFYDFDTDNLYAGDDSGNLHKFTGVFFGAPAEVTTGGWPIAVRGGHVLTGPVVDNTSGNIFVNDVDGTLSYVREVGSTVGACAGIGVVPPCLGSTSVAVSGNAGSITDAPIVDSTQGRVFSFTRNHTNAILGGANVVQADTALSAASVTRLDVGTGRRFNLHDGAFDDAYFSNVATGHLYVCGNSGPNSGPSSGLAADNQPVLKRISFNSNGTMAVVDAGTLTVALTSTTCSPVTEILNGTTDWIFFSVQASGSSLGCIPSACVMSVSVPTTSPFTFPAAVAAALPESGGTSGIVIDNVSSAGQASSIYFSILANSTVLHSCGGTSGVGCAVKATQSGLN